MESFLVVLFLACIFIFTNSYIIPSSRSLLSRSSSSRSSLLYSSIADKISSKKESIDFNNLIANNGKDELFLFLIDLSLVGSTSRIHALQGAVGQLLPMHKVSVITCFENSAAKILEPTSSFMAASRALTPLKKSVMGNLGKGLEIALNTADDCLRNPEFKSVTLCIMADSKAHGLLAGHSTECPLINVCDNFLIETGEKLVELKTNFAKEKKLLKTILIDTERGNRVIQQNEGEGFATLIEADYYHEPSLTDESLLNILFYPFYEI